VRRLSTISAFTAFAAALTLVPFTAATPAGAATVNPTPVRAQVRSAVQQAYPGLVIGNVACPDSVVRAQGVMFACTAQLPGGFLVLGAEQVDGKGRVKVAAEQAVIDRGKLEQFVATQATLTATVACGTGTWLVRRPAETITCNATLADGSQHEVEVTVQDLAGNVAITSAS
jgi:hypothetical protein